MYASDPGTALQVHNDAYGILSGAVGPNLFGLLLLKMKQYLLVITGYGLNVYINYEQFNQRVFLLKLSHFKDF